MPTIAIFQASALFWRITVHFEAVSVHKLFRQGEFKGRKKVDFFDKTILAEALLNSKNIWIQEYLSGQQTEDIKNVTAIKMV